MASRQTRVFNVTVPANTSAALPLRQDVSFPSLRVEWIRWRMPPGAAGTTGWFLSSNGARVMPVNAGAYIVSSGEVQTWELDGLPDGGRWDITAYNTGVYVHTIYLTFGLIPIVPKPVEPVTIPDYLLAPFSYTDLVSPRP